METSTQTPNPDEKWFGVRTVYFWKSIRSYEERVTIWCAESMNDAIEQAEVEANSYANENVQYLEIAQAYLIFQEYSPPSHASEVFSLIRKSKLGKRKYVDRFFSTGKERQANL